MHFIIGDAIMRNIKFFRNYETDRFLRDKRHHDTLKIVEKQC